MRTIKIKLSEKEMHYMYINAAAAAIHLKKEQKNISHSINWIIFDSLNPTISETAKFIACKALRAGFSFLTNDQFTDALILSGLGDLTPFVEDPDNLSKDNMTKEEKEYFMQIGELNYENS